MVKLEIIFKDINALHAVKDFRILITKLMIFTSIFGMSMYMIDVPYCNYRNGIKGVRIGSLID